MDHMRIALEACIPKTYLDEYQGMGKNNTDIKVAVAWFPNGDAMRFAVEILAGQWRRTRYGVSTPTCRTPGACHVGVYTDYVT